MPIVRTFACPSCNHFMRVTLAYDQADDPPPECPRCASDTQQQFVPFAIGGSAQTKANKLAEDIIERDYGVANIERDRHEGAAPKVRLKDQSPAQASSWGAANAALQAAVDAGRENRLRYGSGLDVLQANLKSGVEVDLIEASKRRSPRIW